MKAKGILSNIIIKIAAEIISFSCKQTQKVPDGKEVSRTAVPEKRREQKIETIKEQRKPIEQAYMEFMTEGGGAGQEIPAVTLLYHEEGEAVLLQNLPLPLADRHIQEKELYRKEVLYRVDCLEGEKVRRIMGVLEADEAFDSFPDWIGRKSHMKADVETRLLCGRLGQHLSLCGLEELAEKEISLQEADGEGAQADSSGEDSLYQQANAAYYRKLLSYVKEVRRILNTQPGAAQPPFPARGPFMAEWYREHAGKGGEAA